jgi:hypothetical protein
MRSDRPTTSGDAPYLDRHSSQESTATGLPDGSSSSPGPKNRPRTGFASNSDQNAPLASITGRDSASSPVPTVSSLTAVATTASNDRLAVAMSSNRS